MISCCLVQSVFASMSFPNEWAVTHAGAGVEWIEDSEEDLRFCFEYISSALRLCVAFASHVVLFTP